MSTDRLTSEGAEKVFAKGLLTARSMQVQAGIDCGPKFIVSAAPSPSLLSEIFVVIWTPSTTEVTDDRHIA